MRPFAIKKGNGAISWDFKKESLGAECNWLEDVVSNQISKTRHEQAGTAQGREAEVPRINILGESVEIFITR